MKVSNKLHIFQNKDHCKKSDSTNKNYSYPLKEFLFIGTLYSTLSSIYSFCHLKPRNLFLVILFFQFIIANQAVAFKFTSEVCQEYGLGKNWYCEPKNENTESTKEEISAHDIMKSALPPEEKAAKLNELWELQRKRAVITQNKEDFRKYLETHYLMVELGVDFARNIQKLQEADPKLSNNQSYYQSVSDQAIKEAETEELLKSSGDRYGLAFIYSSGCPYCARQLPILQGFRKNYGLQLLGISVDGNYYEGLDGNVTDSNVTNDPLVQAYPTILLLDRKHPAKIFISKGLITLDELEMRVANRIIERGADEEIN